LVGDDRGAALAGRPRDGDQRLDRAIVGVGVVGERVDGEGLVLGAGGGVGIGEEAVAPCSSSMS
jgi:hypothetical protein